MHGAVSYLDFHLVIRRYESGYRAQVLSSPAGEAAINFTEPFSEEQLEIFLLRVGRPRRGTRRIDSPEMEAAKRFGERLYDAVFSGGVRECWARSLSEAEAQDAGLRLRLHIAEAPELNDIPWEYLYNTSLNQFLSLSKETPLVRYLELPRRIQPLAVDGRIEVLVMISSPTDYGALDVEGEWARLNEALAGPISSGLVRLQRLPEARLAVLRKELSLGEYHILHYIGHAGFDRKTQDGVLVLRDEAGRGRIVSGQDLGVILHDHRSLRLVVLNACEGSRSSRTDPFAGVAQTLVQQGVPAVIAMQFEITDQAAVNFAEAFYSAVAIGYPVDAATAEARKAIFAAHNDIEWGTPVLYLRAPDGRLFSINREAAHLAEEKQRAETARLAEEKQRAETARLAEEKQRAEAARLAEDEQRAETARLAEDKQRAERARAQQRTERKWFWVTLTTFSLLVLAVAGYSAYSAYSAHTVPIPYSVLRLIDTVTQIYLWILTLQIIMGCLVYFKILNNENRVRAMIANVVWPLTEPALRPIRSILPNLGGIDITPVILSLLLYFLRDLMFEYLA